MKGFRKVNAYVEGKGIIETDILIDNGIIANIGDNLVNEEISSNKFPNL